MARVVHFEINAEDPKRAVKFYKEALGWKIDDWQGPIEYYLVQTGEKGTPGIDGAIMPAEKRGMGTYNTVEVDSLKDSMAAVVKAGGKTIGEVNQIPGIGIFSYCEDTEGNIFGLLQPEPMQPK